jgi:hypothetical protein
LKEKDSEFFKNLDLKSNSFTPILNIKERERQVDFPRFNFTKQKCIREDP